MIIKNINKRLSSQIFAFFIVVLSVPAYGLDTSSEEAACQSIGFKKKTEAYANCVLELLDRKSSSVASTADPDDATCRNYGFKPRTNEYATCRLQVDEARKDAQTQQAQFAEKQRQYDVQLAEQQKQRKVASGIALMQMGAGISSGAYNANNGYGTMPIPPVAPQNFNRTYFLPGGKMMNCTTTGTITNCI